MKIATHRTVKERNKSEHKLENDRFTQDGNPTSSRVEATSKQECPVVSKSDQKRVATSLGHFLADTYFLYLKTQNFHWNVLGSQFFNLHNLFMVQYTELALAVDLIAERIRALDQPAPGTFLEFSKLTTIKEVAGVPTAAHMLASLAEDHLIVIKLIRDQLIQAEECKDFTTVDLLTQRLQVHEKNVWMLSSSRGQI